MLIQDNKQFISRLKNMSIRYLLQSRDITRPSYIVWKLVSRRGAGNSKRFLQTAMVASKPIELVRTWCVHDEEEVMSNWCIDNVCRASIVFISMHREAVYIGCDERLVANEEKDEQQAGIPELCRGQVTLPARRYCKSLFYRQR